MQAQQLTIWIPPSIAVPNEAAAALFAEQLQNFNQNYPELIIRVEQKGFDGQGGILSYLRTGHVLLPPCCRCGSAAHIRLPSAATETLIFPLNDQLSNTDLESLYPAARILAQPDEQILGYPLVLNNLPHLVYNSNEITGTLPLTWDGLIAESSNKRGLCR